MLTFAVLGPLEVIAGNRSIVPTAGKQRQVLAMLGVHADTIVPVPALMEELWGHELPRSAATTLQTYVLQLRRRIAAAVPGGSAKDVLATAYGGYLLRTGAGRVDAREFERLSVEGDAAFETTDHRLAARRYVAALRLWRGSPLVDVPTGPLLELEHVRLAQLREAVLERRIDTDLLLGRHSALVPELRALVARHPQHEGFSSRLMLALHRSGGAAGALAEYQRLRAALVTELGLEPSPRVRQLQQQVLTGTLDAAAAVPSWRGRGAGDTPPVDGSPWRGADLSA